MTVKRVELLQATPRGNSQHIELAYWLHFTCCHARQRQQHTEHCTLQHFRSTRKFQHATCNTLAVTTL